MRRAIAEAEVGDDVFSDDPTVLRLEEETAALLGQAGRPLAQGDQAGRGQDTHLAHAAPQPLPYPARLLDEAARAAEE